MSSELPPVVCDLVGVDGNAYALMAHWRRAARRAKWPKEEIDRVLGEAQSGDYDHLLMTLTNNCSDPPNDGEGSEED